jgi:soluble lytic murein transglycosylase
MMRTDSPRLKAALAAAMILAAEPTLHVQSLRAQPQTDIASLKQAIAYIRKDEGGKALALADGMQDPAARHLVVWLGLRATPQDVGFDRAAQFIRERGASWPNTSLIRRRAEKLLYDEKRDGGTVRAFFGQSTPLSGEGKLALAKALAAAGDARNAAALVRMAWRDDALTAESERDLLASFPGVLTREDHKLRADRLFGEDRVDAAVRAGQLAGPDQGAIALARAAVRKRASNAEHLLDAVPMSARRDPSYIFARAQYFRLKKDPRAAARAFADAPRDPRAIVAPDEWWKERRLVARQLLDLGDYQAAFKVAHDTAMPEAENYKADYLFTAGWIALRFLHDAGTAKRLFAEIPKSSLHPVTVARGYYWHGRAEEAAGDKIGARISYQNAARHTVTYYGQLARARLGLKDLPLPQVPHPPAAERAAFERQEPIRALRLLYAADARDLAIPVYTDFAERAGNDTVGYLLLASVANEMHDARALVLIGKAAMNKGVPAEMVGFPTFGLPKYTHVGPAADPALVYAIARQESQFDQRVVSIANAKGLMQVIPSTARAIARKFGLHWDEKKLGGDPVFNVQLGAAELGDLLQAYRGNYVLTCIGYNAGRGRANEWIGKYGDPRDPKVDVVDWIERIPLSETRYYVQRVMENLQVYQALSGTQRGLTIEADLVRGG